MEKLILEIKVENRDIELITFDKNQKLEYQGFCEYGIKKSSKLIEISTDEFDIHVPFQWEFIFNKNVLLVIAPKRANDIALYFSKVNECQKLYNAIMEFKSKEDSSLASDDSKEKNQQQIFNERFVSPLLEEACSSGSLRLKSILKEVIQIPTTKLHKNDNGEDERCASSSSAIKAESEIEGFQHKENSYESSHPAINFAQINFDSEDDESMILIDNAESEATDLQKESLLKISAEKSMIDSSKPTINFSQINFDSEDESLSFMEKEGGSLTSKETMSNSEMDLICREEFDFRELFAPNSDDDEGSDNQLIEDEFNVEPPNKIRKLNNTNNYGDGSEDKAILQKRASENQGKNTRTLPKIIDSDNFEIRSLVRNEQTKYVLIIIDNPNDRNICYFYYFNSISKRFICQSCLMNHKKYVSVTLFKNYFGKFYIKLNGHHKCLSSSSILPPEINEKIVETNNYETLLYQPLKLSERLIKAPNFMLCVGRKGKIDSKMEVTLSDSRRYNYLRVNNTKTYTCWKCQKKGGVYVSAKLVKNNNDDEFCVMLSESRHICEPLPSKYDEVIPDEKIIKAPNFKLFENKNGIPDSNLQITMLGGRRYNYCRRKKMFSYVCLNCQTRKIYVSAKLCHNKYDETYVVLGKNEHICNPLPNETLKVVIPIIEEQSRRLFESQLVQQQLQPLNSFQTQIQKFPQFNNRFSHQIHRYQFPVAPNFQYNNNQISPQLLFRFPHLSQSLLPLLPPTQMIPFNLHDSQIQPYQQKNNQLSPSKTDEVNTFGFIIKPPNFKFDQTKNGTRMLLIDLFDGKQFIYHNYNRYSTYNCNKCRFKGKKVNAKLCKNGNNELSYIELNTIDHICVPINS